MCRCGNLMCWPSQFLGEFLLFANVIQRWCFRPVLRIVLVAIWMTAHKRKEKTNNLIGKFKLRDVFMWKMCSYVQSIHYMCVRFVYLYLCIYGFYAVLHIYIYMKNHKLFTFYSFPNCNGTMSNIVCHGYILYITISCISYIIWVVFYEVFYDIGICPPTYIWGGGVADMRKMYTCISGKITQQNTLIFSRKKKE